MRQVVNSTVVKLMAKSKENYMQRLLRSMKGTDIFNRSLTADKELRKLIISKDEATIIMVATISSARRYKFTVCFFIQFDLALESPTYWTAYW